jgi:hypothetical protein
MIINKIKPNQTNKISANKIMFLDVINIMNQKNIIIDEKNISEIKEYLKIITKIDYNFEFKLCINIFFNELLNL